MNNLKILKPIIFIYCLYLFAACTNNRVGKPGNSVTRIKINFHYPQKLSEEKAEMLDLNFFICYYKNFIIYELPYHETQEINNELIFDSLKYEYFIQKQGASSGYHLKKLSDTFSKSVVIGPALLQRTLHNVKLEEILKKFTPLSYQDLYITKSRKLMKYYFKGPEFDSAYFYYDNTLLKKNPFSLSNTLDSIHDSKLYQVKLFAVKDTSFAARQISDFHIASWKIEQIPVKNASNIIQLCDRFPKNKSED